MVYTVPIISSWRLLCSNNNMIVVRMARSSAVHRSTCTNPVWLLLCPPLPPQFVIFTITIAGCEAAGGAPDETTAVAHDSITSWQRRRWDHTTTNNMIMLLLLILSHHYQAAASCWPPTLRVHAAPAPIFSPGLVNSQVYNLYFHGDRLDSLSTGLRYFLIKCITAPFAPSMI